MAKVCLNTKSEYWSNYFINTDDVVFDMVTLPNGMIVITDVILLKGIGEDNEVDHYRSLPRDCWSQIIPTFFNNSLKELAVMNYHSIFYDVKNYVKNLFTKKVKRIRRR